MVRRLARWGVAVAAALVAVGGCGAAWLVSAVNRDGAVSAALRPARPTQGTTFLVVGNDSRERIGLDRSDDTFGLPGAVADQRADALMLVQLPRRGGPVKVLSVPRDVLVDVEGLGSQRLSWVLGYGGRAALVGAVTRLTGIPVQRYVEVDFVGFASVVDAAGGVIVDIPRAGRDRTTGFEAAAGPQRLDGAAALAYTRSRTYEELGPEGWQYIDDGDAGRIGRQQAVVRAAVASALSGSGSMLDRFRQLRRIGRHLTVDSGLSTLDLARLGSAMREGAGRPVESATLPTEPQATLAARVSPFPPYHLGAAAYLTPSQPAASAAVAAFLGQSRER